MDLLSVARMDHLGLVAGVIKDLGLIEAVDGRIGRHADEKVSCGEAVAAMILNGLGFSDKPLTLAPQFLTMRLLSYFWALMRRLLILIVLSLVGPWTTSMAMGVTYFSLS